MHKPGRPKAPTRPPPMSWRPESEAQRQKYLDLGGAKWLKKMIDKADPRALSADVTSEEWQYHPETRTWSPK